MAAAFDLGALRRRPDVEGPGLEASDAADRLILDEAAPWLKDAVTGSVCVIDDDFGALALGAAAAGARGIRSHTDAITGERAIALNAGEAGLADAVVGLPLGSALVEGARLVLLRLPRSLDRLDELAALLAAHADPAVVVVAGGRLKHLSLRMNEVLARHFDRLDVSLARQKSRVLIARGPRRPGAVRGSAAETGSAWPRRRADPALGLVVVAHGGVFAGTAVDIGTRFLLEQLARRPARPTSVPPTSARPISARPISVPPISVPPTSPVESGTPDLRVPGSGASHLTGEPIPARAVDLACGSGVVAAWLAMRHPSLTVIASDRSAAAVASARETAAVNGVGERVVVRQADGLEWADDASERLIVLNPPFHAGAVISEGIAERLFRDAARVLEPGGELWCVWNSHLRYRGRLERIVGPTRQVARNPSFTVTVSIRR